MIKIIAGGKKHSPLYSELISDYEKRLRKPFLFSYSFLDDAKLAKLLELWDFPSNAFVILADERGKNLSSPEFSDLLSRSFVENKEVYIIIGGAFGFSDAARSRANFVWSFSRLVFPHQLARLIVAEQIYRAQEISRGGHYHHD